MKAFIILQLIITGSLCSLFSQNPDSSLYSTFIDSRDSHLYISVKIGTQVWMEENLVFIPKTGKVYQQSLTDKEIRIKTQGEAMPGRDYPFGCLYDWDLANNDSLGNRKDICPIGWHLPSDYEWKILEMFLGMTESEVNNWGYRTTGQVSEKLKSTSGWEDNNNGDNRSGFNALPAGCRYGNGKYEHFGDGAFFWSSAIGSEDKAIHRYISASPQQDKYSGGIFRYTSTSNKTSSYSVRCIRD
jgi:uncharacterized protein (TIGR02145 family)